MIKPKEIDIGFKINHQKLWELELSVEEINISKLECNLDFPYLEKEGTDDWNLSPRGLIENFEKEISHARRVKNADLSYPIEIHYHLGNWIIIDGVHRFVKLHLDKQKTIKVRKISLEQLKSVKL